MRVQLLQEVVELVRVMTGKQGTVQPDFAGHSFLSRKPMQEGLRFRLLLNYLKYYVCVNHSCDFDYLVALLLEASDIDDVGVLESHPLPWSDTEEVRRILLPDITTIYEYLVGDEDWVLTLGVILGEVGNFDSLSLV